MNTTTQFPEVDAEGYLVEPFDWNEEIAVELARQENIELTEDHWDVLRFMREYYAEHQVAVDVRHVISIWPQARPRIAHMVFELFPMVM